MSEKQDSYLKDIASPSSLKRILSFEVPREIVESEIDAVLQGIRRQVELPGFRKGRAPLSLVRSRFSETAKKEALEKLIPEIYQKALRRHDFQPVLPGEISGIEFAEGEPFRFQVEIELYPQVVLGEYKGLKVRKEVRPVEDSDIDNEIKALRERFALFEKVDRQSQNGDVVIIDYWRLDDEGKPVSDSKVNNFPVDLASKDLIEDFRNALIGVSKGDSNVVDVTYPEDFPRAELRGKHARFQFEVKEVGKVILPELDDEFARKVGAETLLDLRLKIREMLERARSDEAEERAKRELLAEIASKCDFEIPEGIVKLMLGRMAESYLRRQGLDPEKDKDKMMEIEAKLAPAARNMVKEEFLVVEIAKREGIKVDEREIEAIGRSISERVGKPIEEVMRIAEERNEVSRWRQDIMRDKVLNFLYENAVIEN